MIEKEKRWLALYVLCAGVLKVTMPVDEMFWGDRYGRLEDPFGHHWSVGTHVRDVSSQEMQQAMQKMAG